MSLKVKHNDAFADMYSPTTKDTNIPKELDKIVGLKITGWRTDRSGEHLVIETNNGDILICANVSHGDAILDVRVIK